MNQVVRPPPGQPVPVSNEQSRVFDEIASGWYGFRHRSIFTAELEEMAARWPAGRLLNLGCAHGPDFLPFQDRFELHGVDFSAEMLKMARRYSAKFHFYAHLVRADVADLPYRDASFDCAIAVATYHHLRTGEARVRAFRELRRVLRAGAEAFITVWNRGQRRFWFSGREAVVPWRTRGRTLYRYYHLFTYGEIAGLARDAGFEVVRLFPEHAYRWPVRAFSRNICLLVRKSGPVTP